MLFGLFNDRFRLLQEIKVKTPGKKKFTRALKECVATLVSTAEKKKLRIQGAGVGCAGTIDQRRGELKFSPNLPFLRHFSFEALLSKLTGGNVLLGNDAQMGLYGEHRLGAAAGLKHVIGVFFGTGVGAAFIAGGELYLGASGAAGEFGHCLIAPMGPLTGSERQGVLDDFVGRPALAGAAAAIAARQGAPHLFGLAGADVTRIRSRILAASIRSGDKNIEEMVRSRARTAGIALSNMVDFLNPEMVVLGGGLVEAMPDLFLHEIAREIRAHTVPAVTQAVRVVVSKLGRHAITAGAAKMAWDRIAPESAR